MEFVFRNPPGWRKCYPRSGHGLRGGFGPDVRRAVSSLFRVSGNHGDGVTILEKDTVLARRLRVEVDKVWKVGEIFLFVLIGAAVNIQVMTESGFAGVAVIAIGLLLGRALECTSPPGVPA